MRPCILLLFLAAAVRGQNVPLSEAQERLASFRNGLRQRKFDTKDLVVLLDEALKPYGHVVADPTPPKKDGSARKDFEVHVILQRFDKGHDKWERGLQDALLDAMVLKRLTGTKKEKFNDRYALNVRAAVALRKMPTGASKGIICAFERRYMKIKGYSVDAGIFHAVFETLVKRDEWGSFRWLLDEIVTNDPRTGPRQRTAAALWAIARFPAVPGRTRNQAVKRLIKTFAFNERQVRDDGKKNRARGRKPIPAVEQAARRTRREYWGAVGPHVIAALNRLATDPIRGGRVPN